MTDEELIAKFQARVAAGEIDLRPLGELIFGKFDQDWPARLIALARRGAAVRWMPIAEAPKPSAPFSRTSPMDEIVELMAKAQHDDCVQGDHEWGERADVQDYWRQSVRAALSALHEAGYSVVPNDVVAFDCTAYPSMEHRAIEISCRIAGPKGGRPNIPDPVQILLDAESLYKAGMDDAASPVKKG